MARNSYCSVDTSTDILVFTFANKETRAFNLDNLPEDVRAQALRHGVKQKLSDSFAGAKDATDPIAFAIEQVETNWAALCEGNWNAGRVGSTMFDLAEAIRRIAEGTERELSIEEATAVVKGWDTKTRTAKRKIPAVAKVLAEMELERLADADDDLEAIIG